MFYLFWARGGGPKASQFAEYDSFPAPLAKLFVMAVAEYLFFCLLVRFEVLKLQGVVAKGQPK